MSEAADERSIALVTGAAGGIGAQLVTQLAERGATRVYAAVRDPGTVGSKFAHLPNVVVIALDVTDPLQVDEAAQRCRDVRVLINNAGYSANQKLIEAEDPHAARQEMEVNFFGPLAMIRAFAPVIAANGGGRIGNVLSVTATIPFPVSGGYSASKAAAYFLSCVARAELAGRGIEVSSLILGSVDTKMAAHVVGYKQSPADIARSIIYAVDRGIGLYDTDPMAVAARASFARDPARYQAALARQLDETTVRVGSGSGGPPQAAS